MILEPEKQVTSPELSLRLKELGLPQKTVWQWVFIADKKPYLERKERFCYTLSKRVCSAYTVAELGMRCLYSWQGVKGWYGSPTPDGKINDFAKKHRKKLLEYLDNMYPVETEAEARGLMLEYLMKNKLI